MARLIPTLIVVLAVLVVFALMWIGWRGRQRRQADVPAPPEVPDDPGPSLLEVEATYVATTVADAPLERLALHGLGVRTTSWLAVHPAGLVVRRGGVPDFFIPAADLRGVRRQSGMIGKFVERDGLLVVTWTLGNETVDTGFRTRYAQDRPALEQALEQTLDQTRPEES